MLASDDLRGSNASLSALWDRAQLHEQRGDPEAALRDYATIATLRLDQGQPVPAYLCDRLSAMAAEVGEFQAAVRILLAARQSMLAIDDDYGVFRMTLRLGQVCLHAVDLESAEGYLAEVFPGGGLAQATDEDARALLEGLRIATWPQREAKEIAMGRVDGCLTLARLWAATGRFGPAIEAAERALALLPGAEAFFSRSGIAIFLVELYLERGDVVAAREAEARHQREAPAGDMSPRRDATRWELLAARRACIEGRLSEARSALSRALDQRDAPLGRLDLQVVWMLATLLAQMNRIGEAEQVIERAAQRLVATPMHERWRQDLTALARLIRHKRSSAAREMALPFVPQQVWSEAPEDDGQAPSSVASTALEPETGDQERFSDRWASQVNGVLLALHAGQREIAVGRLGELERLVTATDSRRILTRTRYLRALIDDQGGAHQAARKTLLSCLEDARRQGLPLDELQYIDLLARISARIGAVEEYQRRSAEAKELLDRLSAALDGDDEVYWKLNKWSQQDTYLSARIASLAAIDEPRLPIASVAAWAHRRRLQRETLKRYREVSCLVGWNIERRVAPSSVGATPRSSIPCPDDAVSSIEVEAWVRAELALSPRRGKPGARPRSFIDGWWPLHRIPRGVAIVQYYAVADRLFAFVLVRGRISVSTLPVTRIELDEAVRAVLGEVMQQYHARIGDRRVNQALSRLAADVGVDRIFAPLVGVIEHVIIIPHDTLVHVPFAALPCGEGGRLCEHFTLRYAPNLRWVDPRTAANPAPAGHDGFVGIAVRNYPSTEYRPLPGAVEEVRRIAAMISGHGPAPVLEDAAAHPAAVLTAMERAGWLHIACHGVFDRSTPHRSRLLVAGPCGTTAEVSLADIQQRNLEHVRLVVLACCWSASAAVLPGGELVCLPAAFLRAGAQGVMAPLWEVDDTINVAFMEDFYQASMRWPPPRALAEVQRRWLRSGAKRREMAFHWAAYQHHGSGPGARSSADRRLG